MRQIICLHDGLILVSLACVSSETHNPQPVFLRIYGTKGESLCQAFLAETVETGNKNRWVTEATHVLRKKAFRAFLNVSVHEFYRLKALIALEQMNTTEWSKRNENLN